MLLVDDSRVNLLMGSKILGSFGLNVVTAGNGKEAIEHCKTHKFHLIFMDLEMPELAGIEAATVLREQKISYAPIYALTANNDDSTRLLCRAHMNGFINKPLKKEKIEKVLDRVFWDVV